MPHDLRVAEPVFVTVGAETSVAFRSAKKRRGPSTEGFAEGAHPAALVELPNATLRETSQRDVGQPLRPPFAVAPRGKACLVASVRFPTNQLHTVAALLAAPTSIARRTPFAPGELEGK